MYGVVRATIVFVLLSFYLYFMFMGGTVTQTCTYESHATVCKWAVTHVADVVYQQTKAQ